MSSTKSRKTLAASVRTRPVYRVVFVAGQWFVRKGPMGQRARPVGEGYARRHDALRGAERRRTRDREPLSSIQVCDRAGKVEYTR